MIECSKRLREIIQWIDKDIIADVGCDHAYVAVDAILEKKANKAYACDIAQGPLDHALQTIQTWHVEDQVFCILMNGIENLPKDVQQIIIAGMGSSTMISILEEGIRDDISLLLSPHKDAHLLRQYLSNSGYVIEKEKIVQEEKHFYPILKVCKGTQVISNSDIYYGHNVEESKEYRKFLQYEWNKWNSIIEKVPEKKQKEIRLRLDILNVRLQEFQTVDK